MSTLYLVEHLPSGSNVAMKVADLPRQGVLVREHALLARVQHPNIIRSYEHGLLRDDREYLMLELIPGADLAAWLGSIGRLPIRRALSVLWQLASAVDHLHARGVVHSDIKPTNIMLNVHGEHVTLIDFGVAFDLATENAQRGSTGTPGYMAPEQLRAEGCSPATDRYAVAAVALELLGLSPALGAAAASNPRGGAIQVPGYSAAVRSVFRRALHARPEKRYPSARAFVSALTRAACLAPSPHAARPVPTPAVRAKAGPSVPCAAA
jgi:serine/threonine protein kinase